MAKTAAAGPGPGQSSAKSTTDELNGDALRTLIKHGFVKKRATVNVDIPFCITMLTRIAAKLGPIQGATTLDESLRAIIIMLHDLDMDMNENSVVIQANTEILQANKAREEEQDKRLERAIGIIEKAGKANEKNKGDKGDEAGIEEKMDEINKGLQRMEEVLKNMTNEATTLVSRQTRIDEGNEEGAHTGTMTFANVVAQAPARHAEAVARVAMVNRQVVVECLAGAGESSIANLSEKEILAKAKMAMEMLAKEGAKEAESIQFIHARKTAKGGAILVTRTEEDARWLKGEAVINHFAEKMGGTILARADLCMVVAEYVPVSFDPELYSAFGQVERESGLRKGALREARYIKQKQYRREGQRSAHMLIGLTDTEQANIAIRNGMVIEGKHIAIRRHRIDPQRCLKCQKIGVAHRAAECKSIHDTCGRCAGMHRTNDCTITNPDEFRCVSCNTAGHASVDRSCPSFCRKMKATHAKFPDYRYRFFPTKDPATWETESYMTEEIKESKSNSNSEESAPATDQNRGAQQYGQPDSHCNPEFNYNNNGNEYRAGNSGGTGYNGPNDYQTRPRYGGQGGGARTGWQKDNGWGDMRHAPARAGRGRGGSQGGAGMHQATLDSTFGAAGREREETEGQPRQRWGDEPMEVGADTMHRQPSSELSYA
jgi:hypothetical protein